MNEAELLFTEVLNCDRAQLYRDRARALNKEQSQFIVQALKRRLRGEPLQYILGKQEFMGFEFEVCPDVFIPRPETEILVEAAAKCAFSLGGPAVFGPKILDIGTGSGCISISLAKLLPQARITAVDISKQSLEKAKSNARLNNVGTRVRFIQSDLFTQEAIGNTQYDIIVSNPPYIVSSIIDGLDPEISYEPRIALDGGEDGLDFHRTLG